jgi:hypothetical protein
MVAGPTLVLDGPEAGVRQAPALALDRLMLGRPVEEALALLPRLFSLCGMAQGMAFRLSLGLPHDRAADPAREILRDHVARLCLDWPVRMGLAPVALPPGWQAGGPALARALTGGDLPRDAAGLRDWMARGGGVAPVLAEIAAAFPAVGAGVDLPLVTPGTALSEEALENSVAARRASHPLVAAVARDWGRGPLWQAVARLADALAVMAGDLPAPVVLADGTAVVPAARGTYALRARAEAGRIVAFARRTPTDHLTAPGGSLERLLRAFAPLTPARAELLAAVMDPCLPVTVRETADA